RGRREGGAVTDVAVPAELLERGALLAEAVLGAVGSGRAGAGAARGAGPGRGRHELLNGAGRGPRVPAAAHPVHGGRGAAAQRRLHFPQPAQRLQQQRRRRAPHAPRHGAARSHRPAATAAPPRRHPPRARTPARPPPLCGRHDTGSGAGRCRHRPPMVTPISGHAPLFRPRPVCAGALGVGLQKKPLLCNPHLLSQTTHTPQTT
uniref:Uncharacterized protein n=1 Tax=Phasianus colchicus TaxID=9054 RepID=A0A669PHX3_PHACC